MTVQAYLPQRRVPEGLFIGTTAFFFGFYNLYEALDNFEPTFNEEIRNEMMNDDTDYVLPREILNELTEATNTALSHEEVPNFS